MRSSAHTRMLRMGFIAASAVAALAVTACGGSESDSTASTTSGSSAKVAEAKQLVAAAEKAPTTFEAPGPAFDASKARGKSAWMVASLSIPSGLQSFEGAKEGAGTMDVKMTGVDGKSQVPVYQRTIQQATAAGADAIIVKTFPPKLFAPDLNKAAKKGVAVISSEAQDPGPLSPDGPPSVKASVDLCHACAGRLMADFAVADSNGKANVLIIWSSDARTIGEPQLKGIKSELARLCPDCKTKLVDVPLAQWATRLATVTQSAVTSDPSINYVMPLYDGAVPFMAPAVKAANAQKRVKFVTNNATAAVLKMLKNDDVVAADVGNGQRRVGWAHADQLLRVLSGAKPVEDVKVPLRLFTSNNIDSVDLDGSEDDWYGDVDYRKAYQDLWRGSH